MILTATTLIFVLLGKYSENGGKENVDAPLDTVGADKKDYSEFATGCPLFSESDITVSAKSALLCTDGGILLYEKNADAPLPMASITKVMTATVALERLRESAEDIKIALQTETAVDKRAVGTEGSSVYLREGETVTFEMLLYSLMLESANDAAVAIACALYGSEDAFVKAMNEKAASLSMNTTVFKNPHGLSEDGHYTTARDYARLMAYATEDPVFTEIIGTKKKVCRAADGELTRVLTNHNRLLATYKNMIGGKTGFTKLSGRTLVTAAEKDGTRLICVTINASDDWNDHTSLYEKGFAVLKTEILTSEKCGVEIPTAGGERDKAYCALKEAVKVTVKADTEITVKYFCPRILFAPVCKGDSVGRVEIYADGTKIFEAELYAYEDIKSSENGAGVGFFEKMIAFFDKKNKGYGLIV